MILSKVFCDLQRLEILKGHGLNHLVYVVFLALMVLVGGHLTFERVTFSPSQKGHQQNCQVFLVLFSGGLFFLSIGSKASATTFRESML